jgi:transcriptional regulator with XRE-family HTH domain
MQAVFKIFEKEVYTARMPAGRPSKKSRPLLGGNITKARKEKGLTQLELAQLLGMTQQGVAYLEREATSLKVDQLAAIADALDTSVDFLLGRPAKVKRIGGPTGRGKRLFEAAAKLPRAQQDKVYDVLESFVKDHAKAS